MASSVQFENTYPEDERWMEAGAEAFAVHFAACCYADRKNTDGLIPKVMVARVALAVAPERVEMSIESLIRTGFWTEEKTSYRIVNYVEDKIGIAAEEKLANRARWAEDKRWRRKHNAGNHEECPPEKCRQSGKVSHMDISGTPRRTPKRVPEDSSRTTRYDSIRLDSTRLDPKGEASERESERRPSGPASAGATASPRSARAGAGALRPGDVIDNPYGPPPYGVSVESWVRISRMAEAGEFDDDGDADSADALDGLIPAAGQ